MSEEVRRKRKLLYHSPLPPPPPPLPTSSKWRLLATTSTGSCPVVRHRWWVCHKIHWLLVVLTIIYITIYFYSFFQLIPFPMISTSSIDDPNSLVLPERMKSSMVVGMEYDLDVFIPLNNASTTFDLDQFQFIVLHDQLSDISESIFSILQKSSNNIRTWKVPPVNQIISSDVVNTRLHKEQFQTDPICQVICRFDKRSFAYVHFPHFLQQAIPCYNIFQYFAQRTRVYTTPISPLVSPIQPQHPWLLHNYMVLPEPITSSKHFSSYIQDFIKAMENSPYHVHMIYGFNESIPVPNDCFNVPVAAQPKHRNKNDQFMSSSSSSTTSKTAILATKAFADTGWDHPVRYFLSSEQNTNVNAFRTTNIPQPPPQQWHSKHNDNNNYELVQQIQRSVLGENYYRNGPSLLEMNGSTIGKMSQPPYRQVQILILDRKQSARDFAYSDDIQRRLHNYLYNHTSSSSRSRSSGSSSSSSSSSNNSNGQGKNDPEHDKNNAKTNMSSTAQQYRLIVTYVSSFHTYTLQEQASFMHHADIIYSPHGAQLSNLLYIRPCTVTVEFFPRGYYLQFFQSLVVAALGIPFEAYPTATVNYTDKISDTIAMTKDYSSRKAARSTSIDVPVDFFIRTLPQIMNAAIQCRTNFRHSENEI